MVQPLPGYRVEFEVNGRRYAYHASERGDFRLCEGTPRRPLENGALK
jgi:hypothetical protein